MMTVEEKEPAQAAPAARPADWGKRLKDKVAIVTGGAMGIGRSTVERLAEEGAKVVVIDIDQAACEKVAGELKAAHGVDALGVGADVTDADAVTAAVKSITKEFGKIDILINNAGITRDNLLMRMSEDDWDKVMAVNLKGAFLMTKACIRPMLKAHAGRIINIASVVGLEGNAGQSNYAASKAGIVGFTKACAKEFASRNILVNAIAPGFIKTRLTDAIPEDAKQKLYDRILLSRIGDVHEIANVIFFLASEDASYITGQVITVDGGREL